MNKLALLPAVILAGGGQLATVGSQELLHEACVSALLLSPQKSLEGSYCSGVQLPHPLAM